MTTFAFAETCLIAKTTRGPFDLPAGEAAVSVQEMISKNRRSCLKLFCAKSTLSSLPSLHSRLFGPNEQAPTTFYFTKWHQLPWDEFKLSLFRFVLTNRSTLSDLLTLCFSLCNDN
jgi:hypothetical protein